jgi:DNA repair exonuclease SbcCD nuclease subunit
MKIALIADTHWGIRNDSIIIADALKRFLDDTFFPTLRANGIDHVIHLGDLVDRRKYINFNTAKRLREDFLDPLQAYNITMDIIAGNHDVYYKNTNKVNALDELLFGKYKNICIYTDAVTVDHNNGIPILYIPWINDENRQHTLNEISNTRSQIVFGHLELAGFDLFRGHKNDHGDDPNIFNRFDLVCSGHYHTRSDNGSIFYLGCPVQFSWSDYNDIKGFHIFDTETRDLEFVPNPDNLFDKFFYDDLGKSLDDVIVFDQTDYRNKYIKLIVKNKTNPYWFDIVVEKLEKAGLADLQVVEDHLNLDLTEDSDIVDQAEDTITILHKYVDSMAMQADKKRVEKIIQNLYNEALTIG